MIAEYTVNLKNKTKDELIMLVKEGLEVIQKQQTEIENLKNKKERQLKRFSRYKENIENKHEEIYEDLVQEIEKKDKIIDKMANYINEKDIDEDICMKNVVHTELCNEENSNCIECIKKHFERMIENE